MPPKNSIQMPELSRRTVLIGLGAVGALALAGVNPFSHDSSDDLREIPRVDQNEYIDSANTEALRGRVEQLREYTVPELANYILGSEEIQFDADYPRIEESMRWAKHTGAFPLVHPDGDSQNGLEDVSAHVPVQKPLLLLLAVMRDSGISYEITSLSTSSEHGQTSHHYQGRGVDIAVSGNPVPIMQLVHTVHTNNIIPIDESFAPGNPGGFGLNEGMPSDATEGTHIHISTRQSNRWREIELLENQAELFEDEQARAVAASLQLGPGSYFNMSREAGESLASIGGFEVEGSPDQVFTELFPAEVVARKEAIRLAAAEAGIPANFLAAITTIESAGIPNLSSSADAHGIVQIVPEYHRDRIDSLSGVQFETGEAGDDARRAFLRDNPDVTLRIGANFLRELIDNARANHPDLHPNHTAIYARAAAGYNGGPANITADFSSWPLESQLYANFTHAFYVDASIARVLRQAGNSSEEISDKLSSPSMWARLVAFRALGGKSTYQDYSNAYRRLETAHPGAQSDGRIHDTEARTLFHLALAGYENFENDALAVTKGLPPALQFWMAHGGYSLFGASELNRAQQVRLQG